LLDQTWQLQNICTQYFYGGGGSYCETKQQKLKSLFLVKQLLFNDTNFVGWQDNRFLRQEQLHKFNLKLSQHIPQTPHKNIQSVC